jgi:hypothetical protein
MGVKFLKNYINANCIGVRKCNLNEFSNKRIVVDASIYLYKYKGQQMLVNGIINLIGLFAEHNISPVFVFDGKPKHAKRDELIKRKTEKINAWQQLKALQSQGLTDETLQMKSTRVSKADINTVKNILDRLGVLYIDALYEADEVCAMLMLHNQVDVCLSDDTDMFVFGCNTVMRELSPDGMGKVYNLNKILFSMNMNFQTFKQLCIISGNDYYKSDKNLYYYINLYKKCPPFCNFYEWLYNHGHIKDYESLKQAFNHYELEPYLDQYKILYVSSIRHLTEQINLSSNDRFCLLKMLAHVPLEIEVC